MAYPGYGTKYDAEIKRLAEEGYNLKETCEALGVSDYVVRQGRRRLGIQTKIGGHRKGHGEVNIYNDRIRELWELGFSVSDIHDDPDIFLSMSCISSKLKKMGYTVERRYQRNKHFKAKELEKIAYLYNHEDCYTVKEIAEKLGYSCHTSISRRLNHIPYIKRRTRAETVIGKRRRNGKIGSSTSSFGVQSS